MAKNKFLERKINCLSFDEWINQNSSQVEREYEILEDEYGDALTCLLSDYKEQKYREYLQNFRLEMIQKEFGKAFLTKID